MVGGMTADLSLNTKLLSLGRPQQKGGLAAPVPGGASFWVKVSILPCTRTSRLRQTNLHNFTPPAAVL